MAVNLDDGGIDHGVLHVRVVRDGVEQPLEHIGSDRIAETREDTVPLTEGGRQVAPRTARTGNPKHCFDKQPAVVATAPGIARFTQAQRLHLRPLGVAQNKSVHPELESQHTDLENPESLQTLAGNYQAVVSMSIANRQGNLSVRYRLYRCRTGRAMPSAGATRTCPIEIVFKTKGDCLGVQTQSAPPNYDGSNSDGGCEVCGKLVVAYGEASPVLESTEHSFDEIALLVGTGVAWMHALSCRIVWNHRPSAALEQEAA